MRPGLFVVLLLASTLGLSYPFLPIHHLPRRPRLEPSTPWRSHAVPALSDAVVQLEDAAAIPVLARDAMHSGQTRASTLPLDRRRARAYRVHAARISQPPS